MNENMQFLQEWAERYPHSAAALVGALKITPRGRTVYIPASPRTQAAPEFAQASDK